MTDLADTRDDTGPFLGWPAEPVASDEHPPEGPIGEPAERAVEPPTGEAVAAAPLPEGLAPLVALLASRAVDPATIGEMLAIQREYRAERAREAYAAALARFRTVAPTLDKDREVVVEREDGADGRASGLTTTYRHTSLGHAMETINPLLGELGLNLSWHPRVEDGVVHVETRLTHALGHAESVTLPGAPDRSGGKNAIQAMKSTITYLERTGALALLGLAGRDDDDGRAAEALEPEGAPVTLLDDAQASTLDALLHDVERLDPGARRRWFAHYGGVFPAADNAIGLAVPADLFDRAERQLLRRLAECHEATGGAAGGMANGGANGGVNGAASGAAAP